MRRSAALVAILMLTSGCASVPPLDYSYYPSKGSATVALSQTFACSKDKKRLVVVTTQPSVIVSYSADYEAGLQTLTMSQMQGQFSDNDFTIKLRDDGRLESINSVSTGQGETILKNAISVIGAVTGFVGGAGASTVDEPELAVCSVIAGWGDDEGTVTVNFAKLVNFEKDANNTPINIEPTIDSAPLFADLIKYSQVAWPQMQMQLGPKAMQAATTSIPESDSSYIWLTLQKIWPSKFDVTLRGTEIFSSNIPVPRREYYKLPLPKAAAFGKSTVAVTVAESGMVTSIQYAGEVAASGALSVIDTAATEFAPRSADEKAAALGAQADLIIQSRRLAKCRAQPDQCE